MELWDWNQGVETIQAEYKEDQPKQYACNMYHFIHVNLLSKLMKIVTPN